MYASAGGHTECVKVPNILPSASSTQITRIQVLLSNGANPSVQSHHDGDTPLHKVPRLSLFIIVCHPDHHRHLIYCRRFERAIWTLFSCCSLKAPILPSLMSQVIPFLFVTLFAPHSPTSIVQSYQSSLFHTLCRLELQRAC